MKLEINRGLAFGKIFPDISQEDIASCGVYPQRWASPVETLARQDLPASVKDVIRQLPWGNERKHQWIHVRPQYCENKTVKRDGDFWHLDVDLTFCCIPTSWDDFRLTAVSFGDIAETEFIVEAMEIEVEDKPHPSHYASLIGNFQREFGTISPLNGQIVQYFTTNAHRAGPIRKTGWRLLILAVETNAKPEWP